MEQFKQVDRVTAMLAEQIARTHNVIMGMHEFACRSTSPVARLEFMKASSRLIRAQTAAVLALKQLKKNSAQAGLRGENGANGEHPPILKTNVPGAGDAEAVHGS